MALTAAGAVAGLSAVGAYLNAKYHLGHDIKLIKRRKAYEKWYAEMGMQAFPSMSTKLDI